MAFFDTKLDLNSIDCVWIYLGIYVNCMGNKQYVI